MMQYTISIELAITESSKNSPKLLKLLFAEKSYNFARFLAVNSSISSSFLSLPIKPFLK